MNYNYKINDQVLISTTPSSIGKIINIDLTHITVHWLIDEEYSLTINYKILSFECSLLLNFFKIVKNIDDGLVCRKQMEISK